MTNRTRQVRVRFGLGGWGPTSDASRGRTIHLKGTKLADYCLSIFHGPSLDIWSTTCHGCSVHPDDSIL